MSEYNRKLKIYLERFEQKLNNKILGVRKFIP